MKSDDVREVEAMLDMVSKKIPGLFSTLRDVIYSQEAAKGLGQSAAAFFKELKDGGMNEEQAFKLTRDYLAAIKNIGNVGNMDFKKEKKQDAGEDN